MTLGQWMVIWLAGILAVVFAAHRFGVRWVRRVIEAQQRRD